MTSVSIITPVYNGERYIENCLQTVIDQDCNCVEHIIVDGNSRDATSNIVQRYTNNYAHIKWLSEPDKGQSDAMNKGIRLAKGKILGILNVDDYYEAGVLNRIVEIFETRSEPSLVVGNCNVWDHAGRLKYVNKPANLGITDLLLGWSINPHPVNPSAYFYHRSLHDRVGWYDVDDHYAMDLAFLLKAVKVATTAYHNEIWGNYREIDGTKTVTDKQRGMSSERARRIRVEHRRQLSIRDQFQVLRLQALHALTRLLKRSFRREKKRNG